MAKLLLLVSLGCAACTPSSEPSTASPSEPRFDHAVLIVIDTLRADEAETAATPNIDALEAAGSSAPVAWSSGTWTVPSMISLFTGSSVRGHGWDLPAGRIGRYPRVPALPVLPEVLQAAGMHTTALVTNPYLPDEIGFDRGFDRFVRTSDKAMLRALRTALLDDQQAGRRHFIYLHLMGPHSPLNPSDQARAKAGLGPPSPDHPRGLQIGAAKRGREPGAREEYRRAYRAVVEDTDAQVGRLVSALADLGPRTLIVLTSDHGELLGEHGVFGHGRHLWEPLTAVPLVVAGVSELPEAMNNSAVPALITHQLGLSHRWPPQSDVLVSQREGSVTLRQGTDKWVWSGGTAEHFDLSSDPTEAVPLSIGPTGEGLRVDWVSKSPAAAPLPLQIELKQETQEALKALGYTD